MKAKQNYGSQAFSVANVLVWTVVLWAILGSPCFASDDVTVTQNPVTGNYEISMTFVVDSGTTSKPISRQVSQAASIPGCDTCYATTETREGVAQRTADLMGAVERDAEECIGETEQLPFSWPSFGERCDGVTEEIVLSASRFTEPCEAVTEEHLLFAPPFSQSDETGMELPCLEDCDVSTIQTGASPGPAVVGMALDLVALRAFLKDASDNEVSTPTVGQQIRFFGSWRCDGSGTTPTFRLQLKLDGSQFCYGDMTANGGSSYTTWCNSMWTATAGSHTLTLVLDANNTVSESNEGNNQASKTWAGPQLDLVALRAYLKDANDNEVSIPTAGQEVRFFGDWRCDGSGSTPTFRLQLKLDGSQFCYGDITANGGSSYTTWCNSTWTATAGSHTLTFVLDVNNTVGESNEGNNQASKSWNTPAPLDLVAIRAYLKDVSDNEVSTPTVGQQIRFFGSWSCDGTGTTPTFRWQLKLDGNTFCYQDLSVDGETSWISYCNSMWTATAGPHTLTFILDVNNTVPESNEGNNQASKSWNTPAPLDLVAIRAYLKDASDNEVNIPTVGQQIRFFGDWRCDGSGTTVSFRWQLGLDGSMFCYQDLTVSCGSSYYSYCNSMWTATAGCHTLTFALDVNNTVSESNENNNQASKTWCTPEDDPDIRVVPTSLTIEEDCRDNAGARGVDFVYVPPAKHMPDFAPPHHPEQLVVKFDHTKDVNPTYGGSCIVTGLQPIDAICAQFNIQKARPVFRNLNRSPLLKNTYVLEVTAPYSLEAAARAFFESELVEFVEINCILDAVVVPNDPDYGSQWGLPKISMPQAWDESTGSTSVSIAIVDTGVDWDHADLGANIWSNPGEVPGNGIDDDGNGFIDDIRGWDFVDGAPVGPGEDGNTPDNNPDDVQGHGTHVAGIASAATHNSTGVAGVGWNCKIMPVRAGWLGTDGDGHMYYADGAAAFEYAADNGASAINYSFTSYGTGSVLSNAAQYAYNQGAVVCVAAANDNIDDPGTLGNLSTTLSVAATETDDSKWTWTSTSGSNFGTWVDVSAPGDDIRSTVIGNGYENWTGTSMAAPFVAGLVGLVCSVDPSLGPGQIMTLIKDHTDNIDAQNPSYIGLLGTGRINAAATLQAVGGGGGDVIVVHNDGAGSLNVSDINSPQSWLSSNPTTFTVAAGGSRTVSVIVDWGLVGSSQIIGQLRVWSDDPDEDSVDVDVTAIPCPDEPQEISGYVRDGAGAGVSGVTMDGLPCAPVTNANGFYTCDVPYGWSGRVTPSKACWEFTPPYRDYSNVISPHTNQNYTAEQASIVISGHVRDTSGAGMPGVQMSGFPAPPVMTDGAGFYADTVPCGWSGTVAPAEYCHTFAPANRPYDNVMADMTNQDYVGTPIPVTISGYVRDEAGAWIPDVTMNGLPCIPTPVTDANGFYSCDVPCGWDGTVTPTMDGYAFEPPFSDYQDIVNNMTNEDYIGHPTDCDPGFEIAWVMGAQGSEVGALVIANGMQSQPIAGLEFHLTYPVNCLEYVRFGTGYLDGATVNGAGGEVHIIWEDFANPILVPDGDAIDTIWFNVLGNEGDTCEMCWLAGNEVADPLGDPISGLGYCCGGVIVVDRFNIEGNVVYYDMIREIPDVQITLSGAASDMKVTDAAGHYMFDSLSGGNYTVTPSYGANDPGTSVSDIIKIRRHIAQLERFTSGYQLIACDVSCDCNCSVSDIIKIRRYLAMLDTLPCGNWAFVDSSYAVDTTDWCPVPAEINTTLSSNQSDSSFIGVRLGDVNNTWTSSVFAAARQRVTNTAAGQLSLSLGDVDSHDRITVPVTLGRGRPAAGVELHLEYDPGHLAFTGLTTETMNDATLNHDGSTIHLVWENLDRPIDLSTDRVVARIEFMVVTPPDEFTEVTVTSAEIVDEEGTLFALTCRNGRVFARAAGDGVLPQDYWLSQNTPNPFNPVTEIRFCLPKAASVTLEIYNALGQRVASLVETTLGPGEHRVRWDGSEFSSGVYFYRLNAGEFSQTRKMVLMK